MGVTGPASTIGRRAADEATIAWAFDIGGPDRGTVAVRGGGTRWQVGGELAGAVRVVQAPTGILEHRPDEMTVRVRAGTTLAALSQALANYGQEVALESPDPTASTVGSVVALGQGGLRRLGLGPPRDAILETRVVLADGRVATFGGPTVKNVTGYDLCRLLCGSLGTVALIAEVLLRTRPRPSISRWMLGNADPVSLGRLDRIVMCALWDGRSTWLELAGHLDDVDARATTLAREGFVEVEGPPTIPGPGRQIVSPAKLARCATAIELGALVGTEAPVMAEIGVGVVHVADTVPEPAPTNRDLHRRVKERFDPTGRFAPGRWRWLYT